MSEPRTLLAIDHVSKNFGRVAAVDGISLDIRENEFFALLGPSGCGKTTLLRMLAGFETPSDGRILLDGKDIARTPPNKRPVNLMFQSYALFPHMSVRANVSYGLEMERLPAKEIRARVDAILATTELVPFADRKPEQLSGGQKQRVALARALVKRPRLLLLDEPLGALDKKLRGAMQLELKRLQHEVGITFVIVTHDQEESLVMADRMAVLKDGKLLQCDTPHAVYEHPAERFVADFIGVMNFIPGKVSADGVVAANGARIAGKVPAALSSGAAAVASVRPERVRLFPSADTANRTTGTVEVLAYQGLDLQLHVRTPLSPKPFLVRVTADAADRRPVASGDQVELGWDAADVRIFAE
ncbi:ABC transporter ATP-binding protein [Mesorhizobium sp. M8A.F.Ca.ET.208.01.1.1]|uniref:ABC transporter ATP-binding protein n=2 Tax=Mesorhizobium TaxID=68287 RepID=UPI000FD368B3|nr:MULTISPECIES: ABC transporter ATP-binding protein [unclassified Mesorhizobium]RUX01641.1 ABC transporter ATP-binding protein [Mesorhizobium sp. M8A.F.Ca.ET.023.01.1.1]TGV10933.1 ABC transporter ATP-binding protein [Mesorhizobium sp. M8A.F.Ca.ET.173.01.1.1]RWC73275.1 MAG: ABC transporter ATP-binding protein [Mesorhizobium sp.]TGQ90074.1 ABC transporter ATP-binding protein [Mesorhizobium sp. M8A.F.Ca.ET.208.01.1.1]TGT50913.1 ABC transporter ATP-binding protein [Mesorhizobium sp. M8A.F.Ca.ET.1